MADTSALIGTELKTWPGYYFGNNLYYNTFNDSADSVVAIFQAPEACDITGMMSRCLAITGTAPYFKYQLQGVDSSGDPDGVNLAESAEFQPSANSDEQHDFTSAYTCTQGQVLCARIVYSSGTISGSHNALFYYEMGFTKYNLFPYGGYWTGSAWSFSNWRWPTLVVQTDITGVDFGGMYAIDESGTELITTTGDRFAQRMEIPASENLELHVDGFRFAGRVENSAGGDIIIGIWPESGDPLVTTTIDTSQQVEQMDDDPTSRDYFFTSTATLVSGTVYYIGFEHAGGAGDDLRIFYGEPGGAAGLRSWPGGDTFYVSKYSSSSWTDDNTKRLLLNPILSSIHGAGGGGSTTRPTMGVIG